MPTANYSQSISGGGVTIAKSVSRAGDHMNTYEITLPVAVAGSLTTRTDDNTGVVTASGHGLATSDVVDVYWSGGVRYGMDATVSGDEVTVDGGAGDVLPSAATAVTIVEQVIVNTQIDGDAIALLAILAEYPDPSSTGDAHVDFQDSGDATIEEIDLVANVPQAHDIYAGATNVFTGNPITHCHASNGSATEICTLKIISVEDSTP